MIYLSDIYQEPKVLEYDQKSSISDISKEDNKVQFTYKNKPIMPTKTAMNEMSDNDIDLYDVVEILQNGFPIRKRKQNIIEKGITKGNKVINVVVVDMGNYYKLIHVGKFTLTKKFRELLRRKKNEF